jgi:phospholipid/cholesterol/gamma-HCH transport system substrate-binding protein
VGDEAVLRRSVKIQLLAFVALSLLGISYVSSRYVGLTGSLFGSDGCTVGVEFPDSGGIFSGAEVTYRGVTVGRVGQLHLLDDGVRVDLHLNHCTRPAVPKNGTLAYVSDRSAVGEQYVDLVPKTDSGPYLRGGDTLHMSAAQLPVPTQVLLTNLDLLVRSVDTKNLRVAIEELGDAFNGRGPDLQRLLDSGDELLRAAQQNLPQTIALLDSGKTVLQTQLDEGPAIRGWAHDLSLLTAQLKASDSDVRTLLDSGPDSLATIGDLVTSNRDDLGVVLANLATVGQLLVRHRGDVEQILEVYPLPVASGDTVVPGDGTAHFGLVLNFSDPQPCVQGYGGTVKRQPGQTAPAPTNAAARCTLPRGDPSTVRGAQNAPGGDPADTSSGGTVYPRAVTGGTVAIGGTSGVSATVLGDKSWLALLTDGLH